jgi:hypothetical protein
MIPHGAIVKRARRKGVELYVKFVSADEREEYTYPCAIYSEDEIVRRHAYARLAALFDALAVKTISSSSELKGKVLKVDLAPRLWLRKKRT